MKKQTFLKLFILILVLSLVLPTMVGCGGNGGMDSNVYTVNSDYDGKGKGNFITINLPGCTSTALDSSSPLLKRPLLVFAMGSTADGSIFSSAGFRTPTIHYFAHYCVSLVGGTMDCGPYAGKCDASAAMSLNPLSVASSALGIG